MTQEEIVKRLEKLEAENAELKQQNATIASQVKSMNNAVSFENGFKCPAGVTQLPQQTLRSIALGLKKQQDAKTPEQHKAELASIGI